MRRTEPMPAEQGVGILQRCRLPPRVLEIIRQQFLRRSLLTIPPRHPPQPHQHVLLPQREIVETAVDGVLLVRAGVLIARDVLELHSL